MDRDSELSSYGDSVAEAPQSEEGGCGREPAISEDEVAAYLESNPDFFLARPHLLQRMTPPERWNNGAVVDLQRHWVGVLKEEIEGLRACASTVIETSRENLATQLRMHAAVLGLLEAPDLGAVLELIREDLPELFQVDIACIGVEIAPPGTSAADPAAGPGPGSGDAAIGLPDDVGLLPPGMVDEIFGDAPVRLFGEIDDDGTLFGAACAVIRSAALVRLDPGAGTTPGLLAFGCCAPEAFSPRQGSELLRFLGHVVAWRLAQEPMMRR